MEPLYQSRTEHFGVELGVFDTLSDGIDDRTAVERVGRVTYDAEANTVAPADVGRLSSFSAAGDTDGI